MEGVQRMSSEVFGRGGLRRMMCNECDLENMKWSKDVHSSCGGHHGRLYCKDVDWEEDNACVVVEETLNKASSVECGADYESNCNCDGLWKQMSVGSIPAGKCK